MLISITNFAPLNYIYKSLFKSLDADLKVSVKDLRKAQKDRRADYKLSHNNIEGVLSDGPTDSTPFMSTLRIALSELTINQKA